MDKEELVMTTAKDLVLKLMDKGGLNLNLRGGEATIEDLGEKLKIMARKVAETLEELKL